MKTIFFSFYLLLACLTMQGLETGEGINLRVATYNIWNPIFEEKYSGKNSWEQRLPYIVQTISGSQADLLLLQEVSEKSYQDLIQQKEIQEKYRFFYFPHYPSQVGQQEGRDGLALFFNPQKMKEYHLFRSAEGTRPTHRRDFYMDFEMPINQRFIHFRVATTHLDSSQDLEIGHHQLKYLIQDVLNPITLQKIDFIIVTGDFNEGEEEPIRSRAKIMQETGFITDGSTLSTRSESVEVRHKGHVDWIYFKKISSLPFILIPLKPIGDAQASDHRLLMTEVLIPIKEK
jgi:endonuclease/exonuclease/phosphatase family metal-dependent hydrolase